MTKKWIFLLALIYSFVQIGDTFAGPPKPDPWRFRSGVRNSNGTRRLSNIQLRKIVESLRHKTGFEELRFEESGFLTLGDRNRYAGGSATARELLVAAVDGGLAIEIESSDYSPEIAFARLDGGVIHTNHQNRARIEVKRLRIDFSDFCELRGEREVKAAFDPGFAILHELAHAVLGLGDEMVERATLGECGELINRMRRELDLPERRHYSPRIQYSVMRVSGPVRQAELLFTRKRRDGSGTETFYLRWDANRVAGNMSSAYASLEPAR